jgi:hypothetical protein
LKPWFERRERVGEFFNGTVAHNAVVGEVFDDDIVEDKRAENVEGSVIARLWSMSIEAAL